MLTKEKKFFDNREGVMEENTKGIAVYEATSGVVCTIAYGVVFTGMTTMGFVVGSYLLLLLAAWLNPMGIIPILENAIEVVVFCLSLVFAWLVTGTVYTDGKRDGILVAWKELNREISLKDVPVEGEKGFPVAVAVKYKNGKPWRIELKSDSEKSA